MRWEVGPVLVVGLAALLLPATAGRAEERGAEPVKVAAVADKAAASAEATGGAAQADATRVATLEKNETGEAGPVTRPALPQMHKRPKPAGPTLVARIDLTNQRMHVTAGGQPVGSWKISSGRSGYATPPGTFRPTWIARMHYSRKYDLAPMPYSVFFNGGIATHGTTAVSNLGRPASHGCIRLQTANARTFYNLVRKHGKNRTRIVVTGRAPQPAYAASKRSRPASRRSQSRQSNAFHEQARAERRRNSYGGRRLSVNEYERRYRERVRRYRSQRRMVWPGDRY